MNVFDLFLVDYLGLAYEQPDYLVGSNRPWVVVREGEVCIQVPDAGFLPIPLELQGTNFSKLAVLALVKAAGQLETIETPEDAFERGRQVLESRGFSLRFVITHDQLPGLPERSFFAVTSSVDLGILAIAGDRAGLAVDPEAVRGFVLPAAVP